MTDDRLDALEHDLTLFFDQLVSGNRYRSVANAVQALRKDVKQKATDELVAREGHGLLPAAIAIILPAELNLPIIDIEQSVVGDGDAVSVACDIPENVFGSGKGRFGVDDPFSAAGGGKVAQEGSSGLEWREG